MNAFTKIVGTKKLLAVALIGASGIIAPMTAHAGTRIVREWIEPEYGEVTKQCYHAPAYDWVDQDFFVPDMIVFGRFVPAHVERRRSRILVQAGYYEDVTRTVIVHPGHWETHVERD